ncbi:putative DNA binding domain-containing protein [Flavobacterium sp. ANB]|uniref:ATP-binding protein n=1 Tax=unclassified Flavobacterium TaxID=196869 RepID=UPI0012B8390E|nr:MULTISPECIES: ATP-binding protein [unclassified Flavobacterium]MBF4516374.1 putative DNA binding domain-containing protein [Flavobacterium sp. ANB]MTD69729.1 hypothetical protein [Flavobacterium sp. LC2016-13]
MSKSILLIDDKEEFKDTFKIIAQNKGFRIAWGKSFEDLKEILPELHLEIVAVILDIKCLMTNDQKIEKEDFIGSALTLLNQEYPDLPKVILTGDEKALDGIKMFFNTKTVEVYKKESKEIDRLFLKLEHYSNNHSQRILSYEEKEILKIIKNGEGKHLEYKSSIQFCMNAQTENRDLRFDVLKNLAAFANSEGGQLLIGVDDSQNIIGLENGDFNTLKEGNKIDHFRLLIDNLVESKFGNAFQKNLPDIKFYIVEGKTVCSIIVKGKHHTPVYLRKRPKNGAEYNAFYIRSQASARELKDEELSKYIISH